MKKILLLVMCCPLMLAAQNGVTVSNLNVAGGTVTFNVSWRNTGMPTLWSDSVWVFVDYNKNGVMTRLPVTSATATAGTVTKIQGNDKGVWVIGNARSAGSFSAKVQLLTDITDVAGACAYASNYPPVGEYTSVTDVVFIGTPMYNIVLLHTSGSTITRRADSPFSVPASYTVQSFTDATGAPGVCPPAVPPFATTYQTWKFGSSTLTWSDRIAFDPPNCNKVASKTTNAAADEYLVTDVSGINVHYYTLTCLRKNRDRICPTPWRVPEYPDYATIGLLSSDEMSLPTWSFCGHYNKDSSWGIGTQVSEWCPTPLDTNNWYLVVLTEGTPLKWTSTWESDAKAVRCVR